MTKPTCYLIGEDHLLIQCAEILLNENYEVKGIYSPLKEAEIWTQENQVLYLSSFKELEPYLNNNKFDYLFSIVNSHIISENILKNVKKMAINYHDGPLPRYGGANATGFAILNNEKTHGITWHVVDKLIDGGDILVQSAFYLDEEETTFTLNVKCYQHGLKTFKNLIDSLNKNTYTKKKQDLSYRLYNNLEKKPPYNGWISWNYSAEHIECALRAYTVGNYKNKFSTLKFKLNDKAYIITDIKNTHKKSRKDPGSFTLLPSGQLKVSTKTCDIIIVEMIDINGIKVDLDELLINTKNSQILLSPSYQDGIDFQKISEQMFKNESFWVKEYKMVHQTEFPFFNFPNNIVLNNKFHTLAKIRFQKEYNQIKNFYPSNKEQICFFISVWLIYLVKLGNEQAISILINKNNRQYPEFISNNNILNISIDTDLTFYEIFNHVRNRLIFLEKKEGYLKDIFYRYPEIKEKRQPSIVVILDEDTKITYPNSLIFKISIEKKELQWLIDENLAQESWYLKESAKNMHIHYKKLIENIFLNPEKPVENLNFLTGIEKNKILNTWNKTSKKFNSADFIYQVIENIANKYPDKRAVIQNKDSITYKELIEKSNLLANYLTDKSLYQQSIYVYMDKSIDLPTVILGILKSGNIYVPIPTSTPKRNMELILKDSINPFVITTKNLFSFLKKMSSQTKNIFFVEQICSLKNTGIKMPNNLMAENLAYILYTSGTTGTPKGVMIRHKGIVNLILYTIQMLRVNSRSRILEFASIGFDASIWEILTTLSAGASLYVPNQNDLLSGHTLKKAILKDNISCIILPPSALQTISEYSFPTLKTVVTGGEYCSQALAKQWSNKTRLINAYGPTESTVCVTMSHINKTQTAPPIGKPISNTRVYVLDKNHMPVPIGVPGELYISAQGLSSGYLNNKELTKKYFIANPYEKNEIMYSTRDIVRWLPTGEIEYVGRIDNQVKIRGFRIELEAIETQILHIAAIKQCAVVVQDSAIFGKHILAYVCGKKSLINTNKIIGHLKKILPNYMIPNFFIVLDKLPITSNGKIDRKKLPPFDPHARTDLSTYNPPRNMLEKRLVRIWSELFEVSPIGINDNFFNLGGHSLIVTNLSIYLQKEFNYSLSLNDFFKNPTIINLASLIENKATYTLHPVVDKKDLILPEEIKPLPLQNKFYKTIFLTGCTGFLGTHLLFNLLQMDEYIIFCHIRANSTKDGLAKIKNSFTKYRLSHSNFDRIHVFCGDLSKPKLGLRDDEFDFLAAEVDIICHNGAYVHHLYNYEMLYKTNVQSTLEMLKLSSTKKNKAIHYISTLSAISGKHLKNNELPEEFVDYNIELTEKLSGYNQTKLVSEYLLAQAKDKGININIYRPGWIMGQYNTGIVSPESNHLLLLIKGCIQIRSAPNWENFKLSILPVDFISKFIINVISENKLINKIFNLNYDSLEISWIEFINFFRSSGYVINLVSVEEWQERLNELDSKNAIYSLLALYKDKESFQQIHHLPTKICSKNTQNAPKKGGIVLNITKKELLSKSLSFLKKYKFINEEISIHEKSI